MLCDKGASTLVCACYFQIQKTSLGSYKSDCNFYSGSSNSYFSSSESQREMKKPRRTEVRLDNSRSDSEFPRAQLRSAVHADLLPGMKLPVRVRLYPDSVWSSIGPQRLILIYSMWVNNIRGITHARFISTEDSSGAGKPHSSHFN